VFNSDGSVFVGWGGFTASHNGTGVYHVAFPAGTFNHLATACFFVPQVTGVFAGTTAEIAGWLTFGDGSGSVDVVTSAAGQQADVSWSLVATSARC
jgi:hypothetical protein